MRSAAAENGGPPWVSEAFEGSARIRAARHPADVICVDEITVEVRIGDEVQRLSLSGAARVAAAIGAALDRVRRENPGLLGDVVLCQTEVELVSRTVEWMKILLAEGRSLDTVTDSAIEHSMLLRRLRGGARPLSAPPPTSNGQPWYQVMESDETVVHRVRCDGRLTTLAELLGTGDASETARNQWLVEINGCHWNVVRTLSFGSSYLVGYDGHPSVFVLAGMKDADGRQVWVLRKVRKQAGDAVAPMPQ